MTETDEYSVEPPRQRPGAVIQYLGLATAQILTAAEFTPTMITVLYSKLP